MQVKFKINRFGLIVTDKSSPNQCKDVNHTHYRYHIAVTCDDKLDNKGFIIDHVEIDAAVRKAFSNEMSSCEVLLKNIVNEVYTELRKHRVHIYEIYGKLEPVHIVPTEERTFMEMTVKY